jgi:hypothetical protein
LPGKFNSIIGLPRALKNPMKTELADYVLCLSECAAHTNHANDRSLYCDYLADAAVLLASAERGANREELKEKMERHERLLTQTWLVGTEHEDIFVLMLSDAS